MREPRPIQRQTIKTGLTMRSFGANRAKASPSRIGEGLADLVWEFRTTLPNLLAYVGMLAVLATAGLHVWQQLPPSATTRKAQPTWSLATRSYPAFALSQSDLGDKSDTYEIFRHPEGGRKDVFRWTDIDDEPGTRPMAELEIYRPGGELTPASLTATAELAARMGLEAARLQSAGLLESKFGPVTLLRPPGGPDDNRACLGFSKDFDQPHFRISGWSCQSDSLAARRTAIGCMLSRLILLTAGNDPKLAELFAHAELRRGDCASAASRGGSADWLTAVENPELRSAF